jgi:hypothetical protein
VQACSSSRTSSNLLYRMGPRRPNQSQLHMLCFAPMASTCDMPLKKWLFVDRTSHDALVIETLQSFKACAQLSAAAPWAYGLPRVLFKHREGMMQWLGARLACCTYVSLAKYVIDIYMHRGDACASCSSQVHPAYDCMYCCAPALVS